MRLLVLAAALPHSCALQRPTPPLLASRVVPRRLSLLSPLSPSPSSATPLALPCSLRERLVHKSSGRRVAVATCLSVLTALNVRPCIASGAQLDRTIQEAYAAFASGDYERSEKLWSLATAQFPEDALGWQNLGIVLIINASDQMKLGQLPSGEALSRLNRALAAFDKYDDLDSSNELLANARGNALALLQRWEEAHTAYAASVDLSPRDFESIPLSNCALTSFELRQDEQAEKEALRLTRRDPTFVDGFALLAVIRYERGDVSGAVAAFDNVCKESQWCERYSTDSVVLGRWTPRAVAAFRKLLRDPAVQDVRAARALR